MKISKTIHLFFILLSLQATAGLPESSFTEKDKLTSPVHFQNSKRIFVQQKNKVAASPSFFFNTSSLNAEYVSGLHKKENSAVTSILNWDLKVKFRLNRNMNIIFSYN